MKLVKVGTQANGQVSSGSPQETLTPEKGKLVSRDAEHLNAKAKRRSCRCNLLQNIAVAIAAVWLYRQFLGGTTRIVESGVTGADNGGALLQERGELRNNVREPQQQQAVPQQPPKRGELRNNVRAPQHGLQERGELRQRPH
jgi:hypothetical protein